MTKENEKQSDLITQMIERNRLFKKVITYFFTYTGKSIQENAKALQFWQQVISETNLMDDPEHRKEFNRIVEMLNALSKLTKAITPEKIIEALHYCDSHDAVLRMHLLPALAAEREEETNA